MGNLPQNFAAAGQGQVFAHFDSLSAEEQKALLAQAEQIDLVELEEWTQKLVLSDGVAAEDYSNLEPAPLIDLPRNGGSAEDWEKAFAAGEEALRAGRVAAFTVAGGQGTRLGFDGPKGTFPVTPVTGHTLFQVFAEKIQAAATRYGKPIPWFIMTSVINHEATVAAFEENDYFGLNPNLVSFFSQGFMPAVDPEGKIIMETRSQIAVSPDGHGGSLRALVRSGATRKMKDAGIDIISYFQVDNPLVRCIDPAFIGFHLLNDSELSSKAVPKVDASEKVGVFCEQNGVVKVVEYSNLSDELAEQTLPNGQLRFRAGNIAIHIFSRDFVDRVGGGSDPSMKLPFNRAFKKIPTLQPDGSTAKPEEPNGYKFEMFVFDSLPFAKNPIIVETAREDDFSPVKNAEGSDSPQTSKEDQLRQFARWVKAAGQEIETDATGLPAFAFEISPLFADSEAAYVARASEAKIEPGAVNV